MPAFRDSLAKSLANIDPTEGLVKYVETNKPYHTKILEVLVELVATEKINTTVTEQWKWNIDLRRPDLPKVYNCDQPLAWNLGMKGFSTKPAHIVQALSNFDSGTNGNGITDHGSLANTFLIEPAPERLYGITVTNPKTSTFIFADHFDVSAVDSLTSKWFVAGNLTGILGIGDVFYISANSGNANGKFTIASLSFSGTNTEIIVSETIRSSASGDGIFSIPLPANKLPAWMVGTMMELTSTTTVQFPLRNGDLFFYATEDLGEFHMSPSRNPKTLLDYVRISDFESGKMFVKRKEAFVPFENIRVTGTYGSKNNGKYTVLSLTNEASLLRIKVLEKISADTPASFSHDGLLQSTNEGVRNPNDFCVAVKNPDNHAEAFIAECLTFEMSIYLTDEVTASVVSIHPHPNLILHGASYATDGTEVHIMLPRSYDCQAWGVGGFDEGFDTINGYPGKTL